VVVRCLGVARPQHVSAHRRSETAAVSDAADRLAQALRDLITEAVQQAVQQAVAMRRHRVVPAPKVWGERRLISVAEARAWLGGISPTTFYALVKQGELSLFKIGSRSFVHAEELDDFLRRKRYDASGRIEATGRAHLSRTADR
jgi:excisionase family DNA binding protein